MKNKIIILALILSISCVYAIGNTLPIQIQVTDDIGNIYPGTYEFTMKISNSSNCTPVLFSNVTTLTTDARGIVSYNINVDLPFNEQYYLCYYRDSTLKVIRKIGTVPYSFRSNVSDHLNIANNYEVANLTLGQKITFTFGEIIDNIVNGYIRITGNLNVTDNLTIGGNAIIDKYLHLYPSANQNLANEFSDDGAIFVGGDAFFNKGASIQSKQYGYGLMVQDYNIPGVINRTSNTGEFTGSNQYLCDYTTGFTQTDIDENRAVVFGHDALYPLISELKLLINSNCVELDIATSDIISDFNTSYYVMQEPILYAMDGGHIHMSIGEHDNSHFMINTANGTGFDNVLIDDVSGANNRRSLGILTDSKDYTGVSGLNVLMYSSTGVNGITSQALKLSGDAKGFNNSDLRFIDIDLISAGENNDVIGMNIEGSITHIINQGKAQVLDSAWYDDTTSTTNMTNYFTNSNSDATLFENQNSYIYIGNSHNFTRIGVSLMSGASHTIIPEYYYCNSAGNWDTLDGITDTTDGFTKAGSIIFINPSDRGTCNKEVDGTPFADATDYTYIAIKRTRNLLPTPPVENLISIGGGATNFFLDEDVIRLVPVASPPYTCTSAYQGAIYSDSATTELLWCDGTSWQAFAETSDVTNHNALSGLQGGQVTEYYHLTSAEYSGNWGSKNITADTYFGNWNESSDYYTKTDVDGFALSKWSDDLGDRGYTDLSNFTNTPGYLTSYTETDSLAYNGTLAYNSSLSNYYLNSNPSNYWNDTYATFNKTYADTLYADIGVTGDNSSWNETYADTKYLVGIEADLNVNSSDNWDSYDTANSTWFENIAGVLSLKLSELTSFVNGIAIKVTGETRNLTTTGNISADYYFGDGSQLTGITGGRWNVSGTNFYPESLGYNVGIGTSSPTEKLHVEGNVNITGNLSLGKGQIMFNETSNRYDYYNGSIWKDMSMGNVPANTISAFNQATCPTGWILADGTSGTPDLRGIFVRGAGTNGVLSMANGTAFSATYGEYLNDSFQGIEVRLRLDGDKTTSGAVTNGAGFLQIQSDDASSNAARDISAEAPFFIDMTDSITDDGTNGEPRTGAETRPASVALIYCMKTSEDSETSNTIWGESGDNVFVQNTSKNVGIGTSSPGSKLEVNGQVSITGASRIRATRNTTQAIPHNVDTVVLWNSETFDNLGEYNPATGRFTATESGYYEVKAYILFDSVSWLAGEVGRLKLNRNGVPISHLHRREQSYGDTFFVDLHGSDLIYLAEGDYIDVTIYQSTGISVNLIADGTYNYFSVHRLS